MVPPAQVMSVLWDKAEDFAAATYQSPEGLLMTPRRTGTDGFFVSVMKRQPVGWRPLLAVTASAAKQSRRPTSEDWIASRRKGLLAMTGIEAGAGPP